MKKKYIIGIIILALILAGTGIFIQLNSSSMSKNNGKVVVTKDFENTITGKHCVKKLCIESVDIQYLSKEKLGTLGFMLVNTDKKNPQPSGSFSFIPNSSTELTAYFDEIPAGEMVYVKINYADTNVIKMTDYKLKDLQTGTYEKI